MNIMVCFDFVFVRFLSHMHTDFCGLSFHAICWDTNLSNSTSMLHKAVGASISMLHEAIGTCANEYLRNRLDFFWRSAKSMAVTALAEEARLKYIHIVAAAAITSEALQVHAKNRNTLTWIDCMATVNILSLVWSHFGTVKTARSYSQYIFLRFLVLFVVRFPSRSYSEISVLKTLLRFRILFRAAAHLKRRVRRDIWISLYYCDRLDARFFLFCVVVHSEHSHDGYGTQRQATRRLGGVCDGRGAAADTHRKGTWSYIKVQKYYELWS